MIASIAERRHRIYTRLIFRERTPRPAQSTIQSIHSPIEISLNHPGPLAFIANTNSSFLSRSFFLFIFISSGISGEIIQIDAGHCRKLCPRHVLDDPGDASRPTVQVNLLSYAFISFKISIRRGAQGRYQDIWMDIIRDSWPQDVHLMQELFGYAPPSCIGFTTKTHRHSTEFIEPVVKPSNSSTRNLLKFNIIVAFILRLKKRKIQFQNSQNHLKKRKKEKKKRTLESIEVPIDNE